MEYSKRINDLSRKIATKWPNIILLLLSQSPAFPPNPNAFGYVEKNTRKYEKSYDVWTLQLQIENQMEYRVKKKPKERKKMMYVKTQILKEQRRKRAEE